MRKVIGNRSGFPGLIAFALLVCTTQTTVPASANPCGVRLLGSTVLIVHGTSTRAGDWPWHIAIFRRIPSPQYKCGGTIISEQFALTAAHCFEKVRPEDYFFKAGVYQLHSDSDPNMVRYNIFEIIIHPNYGTAPVLVHDIALIRPEPTVTISPGSVMPICLPGNRPELVTNATADGYGVVVGFGKTEHNTVSEYLQHTGVLLITTDHCKRLLPGDSRTLPDGGSKLCALGNSSSANVCEGDSGGGLYVGVDTGHAVVWHLRGIVSAAPRAENVRGESVCNPNHPAVYTDVLAYSEWIEAHQKIVTERYLLGDGNCGTVKHADTAPDESAKPLFNQYPWNALLEFRHLKRPTVTLACSGVLIHPRYVLTVAHCTEQVAGLFQLKSVRLGEFDIYKREDSDPGAPAGSTTFTAQSIDIERIVVHPARGKPVNGNNNLALLKLAHAADTSRGNVQPICLPNLDEYKDRSLTLTGWKRSKRVFPTLQRDSMMSLSSAPECRSRYERLHLDLPATAGTMCATYQRDDATGSCRHYAAGSPLQYIKTVDKASRYFLAGLLVFSLPQCRTNATEMFVNMNGATEWIKTVVL